MKYYLGIDIGGTKTAVGVFDPDCTLIAETAFPTNPQSGCADLVHRIGVTYRKLLQENGLAEEQVTAAGVACPGPLDLASGMIVHIPTMGFRNEPIRQMLQTELEKPIHLENDANCAALAEAVKGAGAGGQSVVYVTISTGVGCGIVLNGKILDGAAFCAGEIGHLVVEPDGRPCPCGKNGCLEQYASGTAVAEIAGERLGQIISAKKVFAKARNGDGICREIVEQAGEKLAFSLAAVCQLINPDTIVLGGSVTKDFDVLKPCLDAALPKYMLQDFIAQVKIVRAALDGTQGIVGAALYAIEKA